MEKIRDGNIIAAKKPLLWGSWNSLYNRKTLLSSSLLYICTDCNLSAKKPPLWGSWNSQYKRKTLLSSSLLYICTDCNLSEVSSSLEKNQVWISTIWLIWLWPSTRTPRPRGQEIYNFCIPFFGHQNYIQCTYFVWSMFILLEGLWWPKNMYTIPSKYPLPSSTHV